MIYKFSVKDDNNNDKIFYLTADNLSQLYRRILSTYRIMREDVKLLAEYEETDDDGYKLKKSYESNVNKSDFGDKIVAKADKIYSKRRRLAGKGKLEYMKKNSFSEVGINTIEDLYPLIKKYKRVKVYFETGEKRGTKRYYALVK